MGGKHVLPVTISNCGTAPLLISEIKLSDDSEPDFEDLDLKAPWTEPTPDVPLELPVNEALDVEITYVPPVVSPLDADNVPVPDVATLEVHNNSFEAVVEVPVSGTGIEVDCPKAVIIVEEGEEVVPQTTLHLKGDQSFSPFDGLLIKDYNWSVEQPDGSTSIFIPSATHVNPVFTVNVAGLYTFCLTVYDDANNESCEEACIDVIVIPDEAIHVELTWTTAADPDMTDEGEGKGSDLDLHFAHPFADGPDIDGDGEGDPWFHPVYDAFWFYKTNNWGTFSPDVDDDPHLDRDDIDGWGPENLNLKVQEQVVYDVGVHYWNDHCFGESLASVAIFLFGELVGEVKDVPLVNHDMWRVAEIDMTAPGNETVTFLTDDNGDHLITPNYINADFLPPLGSCTGNGDVEP